MNSKSHSTNHFHTNLIGDFSQIDVEMVKGREGADINPSIQINEKDGFSMRVNFYDVANRYQGGWHQEQVEFNNDDYTAVQAHAEAFRDSRQKELGVLNPPVIFAYESGCKEVIAQA